MDKDSLWIKIIQNLSLLKHQNKDFNLILFYNKECKKNHL